MIPITPHVTLDENEIEISFIRASGPGGQNVNKVASAAQLRFDARHSPSLPGPVRARLQRLAGSRLTKDGVIVMTADTHRTQEANRRDVIDRLVGLITQATVVRKKRIPTRPTKASRKRRLDAKTRRGATKKLRGGKIKMDD